MTNKEIGEGAAHNIANYLESLRLLDPEAMNALVKARVPCNEALASHPTVTVLQKDDGTCEVGLLGILNGLVLAYETHVIIAAWADEKGEGPLDGFYAVAIPVEQVSNAPKET